MRTILFVSPEHIQITEMLREMAGVDVVVVERLPTLASPSLAALLALQIPELARPPTLPEKPYWRRFERKRRAR